MSDDERRVDDPIIRGELHDALRFVYAMATQSSEQIDGIDTILAALVKVLVDAGTLDPREVETLLPQARQTTEERADQEIAVDISTAVDKYSVDGPVDLDCASLIPLCKGRCCRLTFALSFQDLDEGGIRWDYGQPYRILHGDDGYCVHSRSEDRGCSVYDQRPAICRVYDCRNDDRIWDDFEQRIPAPLDKIKPQPQRLYQIRKRRRDDVSRMEDGVPVPADTGDSDS